MWLIPSLKLQVLLYNLAIRFYGWAIRLAAIKNKKAKQFIKGRKGLFDRLKQDLVLNENYIWIHCSSLGEFEQGRALIEMIRTRLPHMRIVLTFFSPSGYELRKDYEYADEIYYLPLDTPGNAETFVRMLQPKLAIFIKYDLWYHYLANLSHYQIPTLLVSAKFRSDQWLFHPKAKLFHEVLHQFDHIFVQDENSRTLLANIDYYAVSLIPDTRIDRAYQIAQNQEDYPEIASFTQGHKVIIGGSTYEEEEAWLAPFIRQYDDALCIVLAPHDTSPERLKQIKQTFGNKAVFYSEYNSSHIDATKKLLVIDQVGILSGLYQYGHLALIGGGFRKSIHNILEPATFGLPIIFGPKYEMFKEANDLVTRKGAFSVQSYDNFRTHAKELLQKSKNQKAGAVCRSYIEENQGGSNQVYQFITSELSIPEIQNAPLNLG